MRFPERAAEEHELACKDELRDCCESGATAAFREFSTSTNDEGQILRSDSCFLTGSLSIF